ncbi:hypothetical protein [Arsenicicoccus piscis]|uniref:Uncharacterized protein n=1 Tax=Arsenicicoccus piscis TaxID=673954 RepID=A0ABQ6HNC8_9MICO|nr:hypothetical protein GCM10025862_18630 [Arsenicicoccus piscis]
MVVAQPRDVDTTQPCGDGRCGLLPGRQLGDRELRLSGRERGACCIDEVKRAGLSVRGESASIPLIAEFVGGEQVAAATLAGGFAQKVHHAE